MMKTVDLGARRAETLRLAEEVAKPTFGGFASKASDLFAIARLRSQLHTSVSDGAVSEIDLLTLASLMAQIGAAAASTHARAQVPDDVIRGEIADFWLSLEEKPTPEQRAEQLAKVTPDQIAHMRRQRTIEANACAAEVGVLAALHGAIQAQLDAQPGYVSAMEYVKDNAEHLGVSAKLRQVQNTIKALPHAEISEGAKEYAKTALRKVEGLLGRLFGDR